MTGENGHSGHVGTIVEIRGVVIDAVFPGGHLPSIYNALEISLPATDGSDSVHDPCGRGAAACR